MAKVVVVHGAFNELWGPHELTSRWLPAVRDGLWHHGLEISRTAGRRRDARSSRTRSAPCSPCLTLTRVMRDRAIGRVGTTFASHNNTQVSAGRPVRSVGRAGIGR